MFLSVVLILSRAKARRVVDGLNTDGGNWDPFLFVSNDLDESPNYDITRWVRQLHLQQCAFVEIGEGFCASESKVLDSSDVGEFFLGICLCLTLHSWELCSPELTSLKKADCLFNEATPYSNTSARVHRRLCDVTSIVENAPRCNCSIPLADQRLYETKGFPTCFLNPLPESLCSPRGVCGIARCTATTIKGIHTPQCSSNCHQRQPFCEEIGPSTSIAAEINSLWSRWSSPKCNNTCGKGFLVATASCQDQVTGKPAIDCIGPGSFCCPDNFGKCYCMVNLVDGFLKAARFTEPCTSTEGCTSSNAGTFTFEGELDPGNNINDFDEAYENDDRERFGGTLYSSNSLRASQRHLLHTHDDDQEEKDYGLREKRLANKNFKGIRGYRSVLRSGLVNQFKDNNQDEDDDDDDDDDDDEDVNDKNSLRDEEGDDEDEEDDTDEETGDETIGLRGSAKGRRSPRKRAGESSIDYAFEGKPGVNKLENQPMKARFDAEGSEDESKEPLQYYDYDAGEKATIDLRIMLSMQLLLLIASLVL